MAMLFASTGCKKQPSEETATGPEGPAESIVLDDTTEQPKLENQPDISAKISLDTVINNAKTWGPAFTNWFGKTAPDFTLTDITGKEHKLSDYRGKNVMIIFWAPWCSPCLMEVPELIQVRNTIGREKLAMLGISYITVIPRNTVKMVNDFIAENKINYTTFAANLNEMPAPYNLVNAIPCSFFIDPEGKIKLATLGLLTLNDIKAILQAK